jgi:hypothetical protein
MKYEVTPDNYQDSPLMHGRALRLGDLFDFDLEFVDGIKVWDNMVRFNMTAMRGRYTKAHLFVVIKS